MQRRTFLSVAGTAAAGAMVPGVIGARSLDSVRGAQRIERIGVQLYTVRDVMAKDTQGTLAAVAEMGYAEVETAGFGTLDAVQFAQALSNVGLTAPAAHVPLEMIREQPVELLGMADVVGARYLVLPWLAPELRTLDGYRQVADVLNEFGGSCQEAGVQLCYHNHDFEFLAIDGVVPFDLLLEACDADLVKFEMDMYWSAHVGVDTAAYLRADPQRFPLCHVKDRSADGEMQPVGQGEIDFPALFAAGTGLQHYFVEHDRPTDSLASIRQSVAAMQTMRF